MMEIKDNMARKKTDLIGTVFLSMKAISLVQTDIQFKLKKGLEVCIYKHTTVSLSIYYIFKPVIPTPITFIFLP
jgi:hypothetical protein